MGLWSKITKFLVLTVFMLQPNFALCGKIDPLEAMSVEEFVKEAELNAEVLKLFDPNNEDLVQCGKEICDLRKYKCIYRYEESYSFLLGAWIELAGDYYCVDKNATIESLIGWWNRHIGQPDRIRDCNPKTQQCFFENDRGFLWWEEEADSIAGTGSDGKNYNIVTGKTPI